jgi:hypothetical protein
MAFGFIAAAHYDSSSSSSALVAKPTGTADDDIMMALVDRADTAAADPTTVPTGWALLGKQDQANRAFWAYWKLAASEGADYTWAWAAATRTGITIATYRDAFDTASPIDVVSNTAYNVSDSTVRGASMVVAAVNSPLIFMGVAARSSSFTWTPPTAPATFVEDVDTWNSGSRMGRTFASVVWTGSGSSGDMDATISFTLANDKHAFVVALNPPAAGSTTFFQTIAAVAIGVGSLTKTTIFVKTLAGVSVGVASIVTALLSSVTVAATAVGVTVLSTVTTHVRTLAATAAGVAVLSRVATFFRTLDAMNVGVVSISKGMFVTLQVVSVGVAGLVTALLSSVSMAATAVGAATLSAATILSQALSAVAVGVTSLATQFIAGSGIDTLLEMLRHLSSRHGRR